MLSKYRYTLIFAVGMCLFPAMALLAEEAVDGEWERSITLGLNTARGNSDTRLFKTVWRAEQIRERDEWQLFLNWTYGKTDNEKNSEFGRFSVDRKRLFTKRQYYEGMFDIHYDALARIDYRIITGPAYGVFLMRSPETRFSVEVGPSYVREKERQNTEDYMAARLAENFSQRINDRVRIWQAAEYIPRLDDLDHFLFKGEIGIEAALNEYMSLEVALEDRYDSRPAEDKKKNDVYFSTSLKIAF